GSAVAHAYLGTPRIRVVILYPSGRVSEAQEKQFTTLGQNIFALEISGAFDDCQRLVKQALADAELNKKLPLSSANSINVARLIPQMFYYFSGYAQLPDTGAGPVFAVPSGNFGNLTAGLMARRMGLPAAHFLAATNANDEVPEFLRSGCFVPRASRTTLSTAMDVGNPSNFARMLDLYGGDVAAMRKDIWARSVNDEQTQRTMREVHERFGYLLDPHTAVGVTAWETFQKEQKSPH